MDKGATQRAIQRSILDEAEERYAALLKLRHITEAERVLLELKLRETRVMLGQINA